MLILPWKIGILSRDTNLTIIFFRLDKCMRCKSEFLNALSILKEMNCTGSLRSAVLQATNLLRDFEAEA